MKPPTPTTLTEFIDHRFQISQPQVAPRITSSTAGRNTAYETATWGVYVMPGYVQVYLKDADAISPADGQALLAVIAFCKARGIRYNTYYNGDFDRLARRWKEAA